MTSVVGAIAANATPGWYSQGQGFTGPGVAFARVDDGLQAWAVNPGSPYMCGSDNDHSSNHTNGNSNGIGSPPKDGKASLRVEPNTLPVRFAKRARSKSPKSPLRRLKRDWPEGWDLYTRRCRDPTWRLNPEVQSLCETYTINRFNFFHCRFEDAMKGKSKEGQQKTILEDNVKDPPVTGRSRQNTRRFIRSRRRMLWTPDIKFIHTRPKRKGVRKDGPVVQSKNTQKKRETRRYSVRM
ncbi:hypothetical protein B0H10DRAFT_1963527 [Mycena sp. CBHHK59/15]|nr:hypothetical protein B0H10DRAFT_1963527 [Mycena sp. CBHHK59/15]